MPFQSFIHSDLVIVRWSAFAFDDVAAVLAVLQRAHQQAGRLVHYVSIIPEKVRWGEDVLNEFMRKADELRRLCQAFHLVLLGSGFLVSIKRSLVTGIILATKDRGKVFVYTSLEEALARVAPKDAQLQRDVSSRAAAFS